MPLRQVSTDAEERIYTGIREFDRVLGGGIVKGSLVLFKSAFLAEKHCFCFCHKTSFP